MTVQTETLLTPVFFDPKSNEYQAAVTHYYKLRAGILPGLRLAQIVRCHSYSNGIYDIASATDVWTDYRVVKMAGRGDAWACSCPSKRLCWHIAAANATHFYTNPVYNPIHILNGFCAQMNDKKNPAWPTCQVLGCKHVEMFPDASFCQAHYDDHQKEEITTSHDQHNNHAPDCAGCLAAAGNPVTVHWDMVSIDFWRCRKHWGLGRCGGRAVSLGGYCDTCASGGWDDLLRNKKPAYSAMGGYQEDLRGK